MPAQDYEPRTRTEKKRQGKRDGGPYSAKHCRIAAAAAAAATAATATATATATAATATKPRK